MHKYSYIWKPLSPLSVCLSTHNTICLCIAVYFYVYLCHFVILCACSVFSVNLSWGDTCKRSRNTVILVDGNDRAVSFCGQTDSRSSTRAVRLMNEIPLQASQCQKTGDPFVRVCVCLGLCVCAGMCMCACDQLRDITTSSSPRASQDQGSLRAGMPHGKALD